jgi:hypothetical protein
MVDAVPPIPDTGFSADAVPPMEANSIIVRDDVPLVDNSVIIRDAVPPMSDAVPPTEPPMVGVETSIPEPVNAVATNDDAVPPMEARGAIVHDAVPPRQPPMVDAVPPTEPPMVDAVPPMEARGIIVHSAVPPTEPPMVDAVPPMEARGIIVHDAVPPMADAVPPVDDAIPPMQIRTGSNNGLIPNALTPNSLIGNALIGNALIGNGLLNRYQINGDQVTLFGFTLSAVDSIREANLDNTLDVLIPYLVHCALPPWKSWIGTLNGEETEIWGVLGLAADLDELPMLPTQQQLVSACLLSSVNYFGEHIEISTRNYPSAGATKDEMKDFKMFEGAFFGDVFAADGDNKKFACQGTPTSVALDHSEDRELRRCTDPGYDCMIEVVGKCSDVCSYFIDDYGYSQCLGSDGKSYPAMNVCLDSKGNH